MSRKKKPKTQEELFKHILNEWLDDERQILSEWGIGNRDRLRTLLNEEYQWYLDLWEQLKENGE